MSKFNIDKKSNTIMNINKEQLFINSDKMKNIDKGMENDLEKMRTSLIQINSLLNKLVKYDSIKGKRKEIFKGWAKVSKSQALAAEKLKLNLNEKYKDDLQKYIFKLLDERISDIERRIDLLSNQ
ncbi:MAG: hypothetical protein IKE70_04055 [Bacilli bacterium]|nr:hypothetical protein [Bacilli bacterium]